MPAQAAERGSMCSGRSGGNLVIRENLPAKRWQPEDVPESHMERCEDQQLPSLPLDVLGKVFGVVVSQWRMRPLMLAREEVRQWTCYSLVCKRWQAAFQQLPICVVFDEAPSKAQVEWLRTTRTPIRRITFLPSCTPCQSTASALVSRASSSIRLKPLNPAKLGEYLDVTEQVAPPAGQRVYAAA